MKHSKDFESNPKQFNLWWVWIVLRNYWEMCLFYDTMRKSIHCHRSFKGKIRSRNLYCYGNFLMIHPNGEFYFVNYQNFKLCRFCCKLSFWGEIWWLLECGWVCDVIVQLSHLRCYLWRTLVLSSVGKSNQWLCVFSNFDKTLRGVRPLIQGITRKRC
jgi:hypothetical protein